MSDPFENLPQKPKENVPAPTQEKEHSIVRHLDEDTQKNLTPAQKRSVQDYMSQMKWGILGVTAITCKDEQCDYYSHCPLVRASIPRPTGEPCPVEIDLQRQWLENFVQASGLQLEMLGAYDMMLLNDLAYQQVLEARAAMELSDNPKIQVKTYIGKDPKSGEPMYTYTLNNLVTFREKSSKMKMKILQEMIATAKSKSAEHHNRMDRSSEQATRLRRVEDLLQEQAIKVKPKTIEADFEVKKDDGKPV